MDAKSKMLSAILVAAIMLGCASTPLFADTESAVAVESQSDDSGNFSFSEILSCLKDLGEEIELSSNHVFMPVIGVETAPEVLGNEVTGEVHVGKGEVVTLSGEYVFTNIGGETGRIVLDEGSTLVLFPLSSLKTATEFTLNNEGNNGTDIIVMKPGSMICIFGMTFQLAKDSGGNAQSVTLLSLKVGHTLAATFEPANGGDNFEFTLQMSKYGSFCIINEAICFEHTVESAVPEGAPVIHVKGTMSASTGGTGITISNAKAMIYYLAGEIVDNLKGGIELDIENILYSYTAISTGAAVKTSASVKASIISMALFNNRFNLEGGFEIKTGDIYKQINRIGNDFSVVVTSSDVSTLTLYGGDCMPIRTKDFQSYFAFTNLSLSFGPFLAYSEKVFTKVTTETETHFEWVTKPHLIEFDFELKSDALTTNVSYKNLSLSTTFNVKGLKLKDVKVKFNESGDSVVTVGETAFEGTMSKCTLLYTFPKSIVKKFGLNDARITFCHLQHDVGLNLKLTELYTYSADGLFTSGFNRLAIDFATTIQGASYDGDFTLDGLSTLVKYSEDSDTVTTEHSFASLVLRNDIPMNRLVSAFMQCQVQPGSFDVPTVNLDVKNLWMRTIAITSASGETIESEITADYCSVGIKDYMDIDEFNMVFSGNINAGLTVITAPEGEGDLGVSASVSVSCDGITGSVKNAGGKRNDFSITNGPSVSFSSVLTLVANLPPDCFELTSVLEIVSGRALFNAGSLPIGIKVDSGVNFMANGLSALSFEFDENSTRSGFVTLDTGALLPLWYPSAKQTITYGSDYVLRPNTDGYAVALDISTMTKGTLTADSTCKLPSQYAGGGFTMTSTDGKTGTFTVQSTGAVINMACLRESYNLSYEGGLWETRTYESGSYVLFAPATPVMIECGFYGWSDGNRIYPSGEIYVMPEKDVTLRPVFMKTVQPNVSIEDGKIVLVADSGGSDLVRIENIDGYWDILRLTVAEGTIEIDYATYHKMYEAFEEERGIGSEIRAGENKPCVDALVFQVFNANSGSKTVSDVKLMFDCGIWTKTDKGAFKSGSFIEEFAYYGNTSYKVSVKVSADSSVKEFKVYSIDDRGCLSEIKDVSYDRNGDGTYSVTFSVSGITGFVIEPVTDNTLGTIGIAAAIIAIVAIVLAGGLYFRSKKS